jgi:Ca2+-binding EF-hand superfamily protein
MMLRALTYDDGLEALKTYTKEHAGQVQYMIFSHYLFGEGFSFTPDELRTFLNGLEEHGKIQIDFRPSRTPLIFHLKE